MEVKKLNDKWTMLFAPFLFKNKDRFKDETFKGIHLKIEGVPREEGRVYSRFENENLNITVTHKIPKEVYKKLIAGKYSTLSQNDKDKILAFWNVGGEQEVLYYILNPYKRFIELGYHPRKKELEIWPKPNIELLTLKKSL